MYIIRSIYKNIYKNIYIYNAGKFIRSRGVENSFKTVPFNPIQTDHRFLGKVIP